MKNWFVGGRLTVVRSGEIECAVAYVMERWFLVGNVGSFLHRVHMRE